MKKWTWIAALLLCLAGLAQATAVTSTEWDPATHRAVLIISQDDWVDSTLFAAADSMNVPMTFNIGSAYMTTTLKKNRLISAWQHGHDVGTHTGTVTIENMTADQIREMFASNDGTIKGILGSTAGGPLRDAWRPDSWVFHGNRWTQSALDLAMAHYNTVRLQMDDVSGNLAYPNLPGGGLGCASSDTATVYKTRGRGLPFLMATRGKMMLQYPCDACNEARSDTTGIGAFLFDLASMRGIAEVMCHQIDGTQDLSKKEFLDLIAKAKARGDIWITTPRKLYSTPWWKAALDRSPTDTLYIASDAGTMGRGTWREPAHIQSAVNWTWNRPIQCKSDQTYNLHTLVGKTVDLVPIGNITVSGPSTWKFFLDNGGSGDMNDALTSLLKPSPSADSRCDDNSHAGTYPRGKRQVFRNLTFEGHGNTAYSSVVAAPVKVLGKRVTFDACTFNTKTRFAIQAGTGASSLRLTKCAFNLDTNIAACGNIILTANAAGGSDSSFVAVGNTFRTSSGDQAANLIYREVAPAAANGDTLANNIFWNYGSNTTSNGWRSLAASSASKPYYRVYWGGNLLRSASGQELKIQLKGGQKTWAIGNDSLMDYRISQHAAGIDSLKSWIVTTDPATYWPDTLKWGGLPLGPLYGTHALFGSIGGTQYPETPFVSRDLPARATATARLNSPWKLLQMVNAGVLPPSDSLREATWYPIKTGTSVPEQEQFRLFLDAYGRWPYATRQRIRWQVVQ